ncbi:hypothetical protein N7457_009874 [Penicillium paradoxum]|uniref:uncharacterized protein n=1 Tax=Penicillium paradoxum TaxID=176176 RepID=UPI0025478B15|nr:uncharacterized protein N7457_009874 [Penicillium paradoxum]KAJ5774978.1 hypothetical protein N7457_009874 [Penicillium paradoxum]
MQCHKPMPDPNHYISPANLFLKEEVYRLGAGPGLRSLPPSPERDFLTFSWGPIVYRTSYAPETKRLFPVFLRCLNDAVNRSLGRTLIGPDKQIQNLTTTYSSKIFNAQATYGDMDEEAIREVFHDFKVSLGIPETELPSRLRICLMLDDGAFSHLKRVLDLSSMVEGDADLGGCWVKVVEENFPDSRISDHPHIGDVDMEGPDRALEYRGIYHGWTMVALDALVEVFDGLRRMKCLVEYHREGRVYLGEGKWST